MAVLSLVATMPHDLEAELSVLAELHDPLHGLVTVADVDVVDFYDERHRRLLRLVRGDADAHVGHGDLDYLGNVTRYAFPLTAGLLASFRECSEKRRRLAVLEAERLELLGITA